MIVSANDELVDLFLEGKIIFQDIVKYLHKILQMKEFLKFKNRVPKKYEELIKLNNFVRLKIRSLCI